jgi:hypothetical protein
VEVIIYREVRPQQKPKGKRKEEIKRKGRIKKLEQNKARSRRRMKGGKEK